MAKLYTWGASQRFMRNAYLAYFSGYFYIAAPKLFVRVPIKTKQETLSFLTQGETMARRSKKGDAALIGFIILVVLPIVLVSKLFAAVGFVFPLILFGCAIAAYIWHKSNQRKKRLAYLNNKYRDSDIVEKIMNRHIWQGQSAEQLTDSIGRPAAVDDQVLKTKKKEIWKYDPQGSNRYKMRITLENDEVIGWESKS